MRECQVISTVSNGAYRFRDIASRTINTLFNRATQDDPRPALAVKKTIQCTAPTPWQLSTLTHLLTPNLQTTNRPTQTAYNTTSQPLQVMIPPLVSVLWSYMLSPPKDAYPFVVTISVFRSKQSCFIGSKCRRWLLHIELVHYFPHYSKTIYTQLPHAVTRCSGTYEIKISTEMMQV